MDETGRPRPYARRLAQGRLAGRANWASSIQSAPAGSRATRHAGVDDEFRTGHIARCVGGEEQYAIADVLRLPGPAERHAGLCYSVRIEWRVAPGGARYLCPDRCIDHTGMDGIDANIVAGCRTLHRNGFGKEPYTSLRGAVARQ